MNHFASNGQVIIKLHQNVIGGSLDVIGALARPDAVETRRPQSTRGGIATRRTKGEAMPPGGKSSVEVARRPSRGRRPSGARKRTRTLPMRIRQTTRSRTSRLGSWRSVADNSTASTAPAQTTRLTSHSPERSSRPTPTRRTQQISSSLARILRAVLGRRQQRRHR
jgi:hypothetical protein